MVGRGLKGCLIGERGMRKFGGGGVGCGGAGGRIARYFVIVASFNSMYSFDAGKYPAFVKSTFIALYHSPPQLC